MIDLAKKWDHQRPSRVENGTTARTIGRPLRPRHYESRTCQGTLNGWQGFIQLHVLAKPATTTEHARAADIQDHRLDPRQSGRLIVTLVGVGAYTFVTSDHVRAQIEPPSQRNLRPLAFKIAKVAIDWSWTPHVHLEDFELSNADWGKADHMFKAQEIEFDIRLWPLLHGDIVLPHLMLRNPEVYLERNAQDKSNWSPEESPVAHAAVKQVAPQQRHEAPLIGRLEIIDGHVGYIDQKRKLELSGTVSTATGQAGAEPALPAVAVGRPRRPEADRGFCRRLGIEQLREDGQAVSSRLRSRPAARPG